MRHTIRDAAFRELAALKTVFLKSVSGKKNRIKRTKRPVPAAEYPIPHVAVQRVSMERRPSPEPAVFSQVQTLPEFSDWHALSYAKSIAAGHPLVLNSLRELPQSSEQLLVSRLRPLLAQYFDTNDATRDEIFLTFLGFPGTRLLRVSGRQRVRRTRLDQNIFNTAEPHDPQEFEAQNQNSAEERTLNRAISFAKRGYLSKAARTLDAISHPICKTASELLDTLCLLHPRLRHTIPSFPVQAPPTVAFHSDHASTVCARRRRGAAPGPTGWTEELLTPLFRDPICGKALSLMMTDIANAKVSPTVARIIASSRLIPLGKKDDGIRPIAVGDTIVRILGAMLLEQNSVAIKQHFSEHQYALMRDNGLEHVVHTSLREITSDERCYAVTIDAKNAFNSASRATMAEELMKNPAFAPFIPIFILLYGSPSLLFIDATASDGNLQSVITSDDGSRQGCPFGMFLFCLALQPILRRLATEHSECLILAIADDITLLCRSTAIIIAFHKACEYLQLIGLAVNGSKCEAYGPTDISAALSNTFLTCGPPTYSKSGFKLLGAYISRLVECQSAFLVEKLHKHDIFKQRLKSLGPEHAMPILSKCLVPRMGYYLRTHPPEATKHATQLFDEMVIDIVCHHLKLQEPPTPLERNIFHLPRTIGGCGLQRTALIAPHAWNAAFAETACTTDVLPVCQQLRVHTMNLEIFNTICSDAAIATALHSRANESSWMDSFSLDSKSVVNCWRARIGRLPPGCSSESKCPGCDAVASGFPLVDHLLGCPRLTGINSSVRHATVQRFFIERAWNSGIPAGPATMYKVTEGGEEKHPDFELYDDSHRLVVDHTFIGDFSRGAVKARERQKMERYASLVAADGGIFVPAVISIHGRPSDLAKRMMQTVAGVSGLLRRGADKNISDAANEKWSEFRSDFQTTLMRSNSAILSNSAAVLLRKRLRTL